LRDAFDLGWGLNSNGASFWQQVWSILVSNPKTFFIFCFCAVLILAFCLFLVWLSVISQIGLINNISLINKNKKPTLNDGIRAGMKSFWPILLINIILKSIIYIIFLILGWITILFISGNTFGTYAYFPAFVIFAVLIFTISFLTRYQIFYVLTKKESMIEALGSAWKLFTKNWLISMETAFINFLLYLLTALITLVSVSLLMFVIFFTAYYQLQIILSSIALIIVTILVLALALILNAVLNVTQWSLWILLFYRLDGHGATSKIIRFTNDYLVYPLKK